MEPRRERLKLEDVLYSAAPGGRCRIGVRMEWRGRKVQASAEAVDTQHGRVRAAAEATLDAASEGADQRMDLELVGIKAFRAFDGWVVVVRLNGEANGRAYRLLGCASCEEESELTRVAAKSVLDATNRVLLFVQPPDG